MIGIGMTLIVHNNESNDWTLWNVRSVDFFVESSAKESFASKMRDGDTIRCSFEVLVRYFIHRKVQVETSRMTNGKLCRGISR